MTELDSTLTELEGTRTNNMLLKQQVRERVSGSVWGGSSRFERPCGSNRSANCVAFHPIVFPSLSLSSSFPLSLLPSFPLSPSLLLPPSTQVSDLEGQVSGLRGQLDGRGELLQEMKALLEQRASRIRQLERERRDSSDVLNISHNTQVNTSH